MRSELSGGPERMVGLADPPAVAATADYIANILPDPPVTDGIYDDAFFHAVSPVALFLNGQ